MKRIATIGAIVTAFAVAPSVAAAGNSAAQASPQVSAQVIGVQFAKVQRAQAAVSLQRHVIQRHLVRVAQAKRFSLLRAQIRSFLSRSIRGGGARKGPFLVRTS